MLTTRNVTETYYLHNLIAVFPPMVLGSAFGWKDSWHWSQQMKAPASPPLSCGFETPLEATVPAHIPRSLGFETLSEAIGNSSAIFTLNLWFLDPPRGKNFLTFRNDGEVKKVQSSTHV